MNDLNKILINRLSFMVSKVEAEECLKIGIYPFDLFKQFLQSRVGNFYWSIPYYAIKHNKDGSTQFLWCDKPTQIRKNKKYIEALKSDGWIV